MNTLPIAAIIPVWNQLELTQACLASLREELPPEAIWLVDNGSEPAAQPRLSAAFPGINIVRCDVNLGFAAGCNLGAAAALASGAEALLFVNNDATVVPGALHALRDELVSDTQIAAVSPRVYYAGSARQIQAVGVAVDPDAGQVRALGAGEFDHGQFGQSLDREALFGCAMLVRRSAWEQVGPFWEPFFAYAEEIDWCLRARRRGWRLRYCAGGAVWHQTSNTLGAESPLKTYLIVRNQAYLRRRNHGGGWRAASGLLRSFWRDARLALRYLRLGQRSQAAAVAIGRYDAWLGRTGLARDNALRRLPKEQ